MTLPRPLATPSLACLVVAFLIAALAGPAAASDRGAGNPLADACVDEARRVNYHEILLDTDGDLATGGAVELVQGAEAPHDELGIDSIVRVYTSCTAGNVVIASDFVRFDWNGALFVPEELFPGQYAVGIGSGIDGSDVIEWVDRRSRYPSCIPRALFHSSINISQLNDYTETFSIGQCTSVIDIPTASEWGLLALATSLGFLGLLMARRSGGLAGLGIVLALSGAVLFASQAHALAITIDGLVGDWGATPPIVVDPPADQSSAYASEDILACYVTEDLPTDGFFFRCDVSNARDVTPPPP